MPRKRKRRETVSSKDSAAPATQDAKVDAAKQTLPRRRLEALTEAIGAHLLPPLVRVVAEYAKHERWILIATGRHTGERHGRRLVVYDPDRNIVTFDRPTLVNKHDYRGYAGVAGHYVKEIVSLNGRLYFIEPPVTSISWGGGVDPSGHRGAICRFSDESVFLDSEGREHEIDDKEEKNTGHAWLNLRELAPPVGSFSDPCIFTMDSMFVRVAYKYLWQRFDFKTESWDKTTVPIPAELCFYGGRDFILGVGIGARSFLAIDASFGLGTTFKAYTYDANRDVIIKPLDIFAESWLALGARRLAARYREMIIVVGTIGLIAIPIASESPLELAPQIRIALPLPANVRTVTLMDDHLIAIAPQNSENSCLAAIWRLHLPTLFHERSGAAKQPLWTLVGAAPAELTSCNALTIVWV